MFIWYCSLTVHPVTYSAPSPTPPPHSPHPPHTLHLPHPHVYRFKKAEDRVEYIQAMKTLLPLIYQRTMVILPDHSLSSVTLQHHILKIFYATMQVGMCHS